MNVPLGKQFTAEAKEAVVLHGIHQPTSCHLFTTNLCLLKTVVVATSSITLIPTENKVRWQPTWSSANQLSLNPVSQR